MIANAGKYEYFLPPPPTDYWVSLTPIIRSAKIYLFIDCKILVDQSRGLQMSRISIPQKQHQSALWMTTQLFFS